MKGPILAAAFVSVMLASCAAFREARMHDARIEQLTRDYVAGRISMQRYHDLCNVVNGGWRFVKADGASASSTTDDTSTSTTSKADNLAEEKKKGDIAHENKAPPPGTPPSPPPR
ncbi:MAG: hypothetical protein ABI318_05030 [Chthoniobacteraceae bacterium]